MCDGGVCGMLLLLLLWMCCVCEMLLLCVGVWICDAFRARDVSRAFASRYF